MQPFPTATLAPLQASAVIAKSSAFVPVNETSATEIGWVPVAVRYDVLDRAVHAELNGPQIEWRGIVELIGL